MGSTTRPSQLSSCSTIWMLRAQRRAKSSASPSAAVNGSTVDGVGARRARAPAQESVERSMLVHGSRWAIDALRGSAPRCGAELAASPAPDASAMRQIRRRAARNLATESRTGPCRSRRANEIWASASAGATAGRLEHAADRRSVSSRGPPARTHPWRPPHDRGVPSTLAPCAASRRLGADFTRQRHRLGERLLRPVREGYPSGPANRSDRARGRRRPTWRGCRAAGSAAMTMAVLPCSQPRPALSSSGARSSRMPRARPSCRRRSRSRQPA